MGILNYTTKIDPDKTASEIARCLSSHGAQAVMTEYDKEEGFVTSLSFKIEISGHPVGFRLPCDWRPVQAILVKGKKRPSEYDKDRRARFDSDWKLQSVRTSWRIVKDWVEAQMALVECQMVTTQEVFLPYAVMQDGRTLSEHVESNPGFLLGEGKN